MQALAMDQTQKQREKEGLGLVGIWRETYKGGRGTMPRPSKPHMGTGWLAACWHLGGEAIEALT